MMQNVIRIFFQIPIIDIIRKHHNRFLRLVIGDKVRIITRATPIDVVPLHVVLNLVGRSLSPVSTLSTDQVNIAVTTPIAKTPPSKILLQRMIFPFHSRLFYMFSIHVTAKKRR